MIETTIAGIATTNTTQIITKQITADKFKAVPLAIAPIDKIEMSVKEVNCNISIVTIGLCHPNNIVSLSPIVARSYAPGIGSAHLASGEGNKKTIPIIAHKRTVTANKVQLIIADPL
jgi:hypothetical protein